ncbi:MAG: helix-turn-helix domain-containing protein [Actinomycetota bacterium]
MSVSRAVLERDGERFWLVVAGDPEAAALTTRAIALREEGRSLRQIARAIGRSHTWVQQRLRSYQQTRDGRPVPSVTRGEEER